MERKGRSRRSSRDDKKSESWSKETGCSRLRPQSLNKKSRSIKNIPEEDKVADWEDFDTDNSLGEKNSRKGEQPENFDRSGSRRGRSGESTDFDRESLSRKKEKAAAKGFDTGKPKEDIKPKIFSKRESPKKDETVKEYFVRPKRRQVIKEEPSNEHFSHVESLRSIGGKSIQQSYEEISDQSEEEILDMPGLYKEKPKLKADFIMVFLMDNDEEYGEDLEYYLANLESAGLLLESVTSKSFKGTTFIKVHIPRETALSLAKTYEISFACLSPYYKRQYETPPCCLCLDTNLTSPYPKADIYIRNRESVKCHQPKKPTSAEKLMVIYEILKVAKFGDKPDEFGIQEMKTRGIIEAAYPLHDGKWEWTSKGPLSDRQLLKAYWANIFKICKMQPIQQIKKYFGPEAGFYYALISLYITMLVSAAIVGLMSFLYGFTMDDVRIEEVCGTKIIMCPPCKNSKLCKYSLLSGSCKYSKLNYLFDNNMSILSSILMTFWGVIFTTLWRRKKTSLKVIWNLPQSFRADLTMRPKYGNKAKKWRISSCVGKILEWFSWALSIVVLLIMVLVVLFILFFIILIRISLTNFLANSNIVKHGVHKMSLRGDARINTAIATAVLGAVVIIMLDCIFGVIAMFLTTLENPRTQTEFDKSYLVKKFIFSFFNNYAIAIYLTFLRGIGYTNPGDAKMWDYFYGINADLKDPSGCVADLWIFVTITVVAKTINNCFKKIAALSKAALMGTVITRDTQWETDYKLNSIPNYYFTELYINFVIQYGFVVFFTAAFPLLPFIVLILNLIEVRINALGLVRLSQRPMPRQTCERELWNKILYVVTIIGIVINALVAGLTTDYMDRQVFKNTHNNTLGGYINSTMSKFQTKDYGLGSEIIQICWFPGKHAGSNLGYKFLGDHYHVTWMRYLLTAVLLGMGVVFAEIVDFMVSTTPFSVRQKVNDREIKYFEN